MNWDDIVSTIKRHEGYRRHPYRDTEGKLTVGYGRNLDSKGITEEEAHYLLINDIKNAMDDLEILFPGITDMATDECYTALVDMMFNLGFSKFITFRNMIDAIKKRDFERASEEVLWNKRPDGKKEMTKYYRQVGKRAKEIAEGIKKGFRR